MRCSAVDFAVAVESVPPERPRPGVISKPEFGASKPCHENVEVAFHQRDARHLPPETGSRFWGPYAGARWNIKDAVAVRRMGVSVTHFILHPLPVPVAATRDRIALSCLARWSDRMILSRRSTVFLYCSRFDRDLLACDPIAGSHRARQAVVTIVGTTSRSPTCLYRPRHVAIVSGKVRTYQLHRVSRTTPQHWSHRARNQGSSISAFYDTPAGRESVRPSRAGPGESATPSILVLPAHVWSILPPCSSAFRADAWNRPCCRCHRTPTPGSHRVLYDGRQSSRKQPTNRRPLQSHRPHPACMR